MRRLLSILLMAIFGLTTVSPLLAEGVSSQRTVPICCRRGGLHQCGSIPVEGDRAHTVGASCDFHPAQPATVVTVATGWVIASDALSLRSESTVLSRNSLWRVLARRDDSATRGPPSNPPALLS